MCRDGPAQRVRRINRSQPIPFVNESRSVSVIDNMVFVTILTFVLLMLDLAEILKNFLEDS